MPTNNRILVVDDNPTNLAIMEEILEEHFELTAATSGEQCLELADRFLPDLVLLDIMMPGIDGYETCRRLRQNPNLPHTRIILVSAKAMVSERLAGYEAGADDYITKPFDEEELLSKVQVFMRLRQATETRERGLHGDGRAVSIPELLNFLSIARKSGVLRVHTEAENFVVQLEHGAVVHAESDNTPEGSRLERILAANGAIPADLPTEFLDLNSRSSRTLRKALLREGMASEDALRTAMVYQVQHLFHRLCEAKDAQFRFEEKAQVTSTEFVQLNVVQLLLESARTHDEVGADTHSQPAASEQAVEAEPAAPVHEVGADPLTQPAPLVGSILRGRMLDQEGRPVAAHAVWLVEADDGRPRYFGAHVEPAAMTHTDPEGRFEFAGVRAGNWWVGPGVGASVPQAPPNNLVAPLARPVLVPEGGRTTEIELQAHRGLSVRGWVLDPARRPIKSVIVEASSKGTIGALFTLSGSDGSFTLGPVASGQFRVQAGAFGLSRHARSEAVTVLAGDKDVVLQLRPGGGIRGTVVDSTTGEPREGEVLAVSTAASSGELGLQVETTNLSNGEFHFTELEPGEYDVIAKTRDGEVGMTQGVSVPESGEVAGIVLQVEPGAMLHVRCEDLEDSAYTHVRLGGVLVGRDHVRTGCDSVLTVPAGTLTVSAWTSEEGTHQDQTVELGVGEHKEVVFRFWA